MSKEGIIMDPTKIEAICGWPRPTSMMEVRSFTGLVGCYRLFVEGFSTISASLARLTRQGMLFVWFEECEASSLRMKGL